MLHAIRASSPDARAPRTPAWEAHVTCDDDRAHASLIRLDAQVISHRIASPGRKSRQCDVTMKVSVVPEAALVERERTFLRREKLSVNRWNGNGGTLANADARITE